MAAWAVSPERNSSTSFGSTGMMMPKDSMSSRTVMRMNSTAARRGVEAADVSLIADASYQAHASACRDKTIAGSASKRICERVPTDHRLPWDLRPGEFLDVRQPMVRSNWRAHFHPACSVPQSVGGCSEWSSSKAAGEQEPEAYPLGYVEDSCELRTKLAGILDSRLI